MAREKQEVFRKLIIFSKKPQQNIKVTYKVEEWIVYENYLGLFTEDRQRN